MATVIIPTPLRKFTNNRAKINAGGKEVRSVMEDLGRQFPNLRTHLFDREGEIRSFIRLYVGEEDIHALQGEKTPIDDDQTLSIIPAIAGGKMGD